jgi:hypothetical protein
MKLNLEPEAEEPPIDLGWSWTILFSAGITGATVALLFQFPFAIAKSFIAT